VLLHVHVSAIAVGANRGVLLNVCMHPARTSCVHKHRSIDLGTCIARRVGREEKGGDMGEGSRQTAGLCACTTVLICPTSSSHGTLWLRSRGSMNGWAVDSMLWHWCDA